MLRVLRLWSLLGAAAGALGYTVPVSDKDDVRQTCSGMYGGSVAHINVTFDATSQGQVAMVIYEWQDVGYLGKESSASDYGLPKTYICTSDAVNAGFCSNFDLGSFILNLPSDLSIKDTTIWSKRVIFSSVSEADRIDVSGDSEDEGGGAGLWDNPDGNPTPSDTEFASPWRRTAVPSLQEDDDDDDDAEVNPPSNKTPPSSDPPAKASPDSYIRYTEPIVYEVPNTGYYCVAIIPLTVVNVRRGAANPKRAPTDVPSHPTYDGKINFRNIFEGELPAAEYPKVNFYLGLTLAYVAFAVAWGYLCFQHISDLLPIQNYVSMLAGFLVIEMMANWGYYRYVNAHGSGVSTTAFLVVVTVLDAGRNALSFFLLLIVSLGLSVVRESLGPVMTRCKILAGMHFIFGVLYATGLVYLDLESTAAFILLLFVLPLAFTLSGFLLWVMHALGATIKELQERKQRYKLRMFKRLQRILIGAVLVIGAFFVLSSLSFSDRLDEDFAPNSWRWRWWLIDGYLALLYFAVFVSSAYLWRPTGSNRRLAMSDEIAQDEAEAEDYDMDDLETRGQPHDLNDDGIPQAPSRKPRRSLGDEDVVFEIGDERDSDDDGRTPLTGRQRPRSDDEETAVASREETQGLMSASGRGGYGQLKDHND